MPFSRETKRRMFERCLRLCCLCLRPCGTKIYAAHIVDEAAGGPNSEDNGIPVCHDDHHEIGHYRVSHPLGNKYQPEELRNRRDAVYKLVESGAMYAMLIAAQVRQHGGALAIPQELLAAPTPSAEANELLQRALQGDSEVCRGGRFKLLDEMSRTFVLDRLIERAEQRSVIANLMQLASSSLLSDDERQVIVERTTRRATMFGNAFSKVEVLTVVPPAVFVQIAEDVRQAFFEDAIEAMRSDQYDVVNKLVPAMVRHVSAVPPELYGEFALALLNESRSSAWHAAPAARSMLAALPQEMAQAAIAAVNAQYLLYYGHLAETRDFITRYRALAPSTVQGMLGDYLQGDHRTFLERYGRDQ